MRNKLSYYHRNRFRRWVIQIIGRLLLPLLARIERSGFENFPAKGPFIVAANHVAVMEVALMAVYAPGLVEFLGAGDLPIDPSFAWLAKLWGFIPIRRGNLDREGLAKARDFLREGGILAVFPEGGIWDPAKMDVRIGVAWLSRESNAPVIPIGFGGMRGALREIMRLRRPKLFMRVGEPIPAPQKTRVENNRQQLEQAALTILKAIQQLIPQSEFTEETARREERYELKVYKQSKQEYVPLVIAWSDEEEQAFARFLFNPVLLDALIRNVKLPISALAKLDQPVEAGDFLKAAEALGDYLEVNPGFFTYRFGIDSGIAVKTGLEKLKTAVEYLGSPHELLVFGASHSYREERDSGLQTHRLGIVITALDTEPHDGRGEVVNL